MLEAFILCMKHVIFHWFEVMFYFIGCTRLYRLNLNLVFRSLVLLPGFFWEIERGMI